MQSTCYRSCQSILDPEDKIRQGRYEHSNRSPARIQQKRHRAPLPKLTIYQNPIISHDIDTQELIAKHKKEPRESPLPIWRGAEQLKRPVRQGSVHLELLLDEMEFLTGADLAWVSVCLVQTAHDVECFLATALREQPAGGVGHEVLAQEENQGEDALEGEWESPCELGVCV